MIIAEIKMITKRKAPLGANLYATTNLGLDLGLLRLNSIHFFSQREQRAGLFSRKDRYVSSSQSEHLLTQKENFFPFIALIKFLIFPTFLIQV